MRAHPTGMAIGLAMALAIVGGTASVAVGASVDAAETTECLVEVEPNDERIDAATFEGEQCVSGAVAEIGDVDVFIWRVSEADAETTWSMELESLSETATEVALSPLDGATEEASAQVQVGIERPTAETEVALEAGTYALVVRRPQLAGSSASEGDGGYRIRLSRAAALEPPADPAASVAADQAARIVVVAGSEQTPRIGPAVAMELVLDTSGSMLERLGQRTKLEVAERTLIELVDQLPDGTPVALRTFKAQPRSCATVLRVPLEPLRPKAMKQTIRDLPARKGTRTPIAKAVRKAGEDLSAADGHRLLVLVTDGQEDCGGDPAAAIRRLAESGASTTVHLIGYALSDDEALREEMDAWATIGGGQFWEAADRAALGVALESATTAPYLVFDAEDVLVTQGLVGDEGVEVEAGVYRVEVLTDPPASFEAVELEAGAEVDLSLEM